ncbi:MAG: hypothetical protein KatS3mg114_0557 [Planctomycetaceae bacterium]|nr:MAG: hypothetical protein KatS3mg114_0557 [Planctomycetaceae bacterium]
MLLLTRKQNEMIQIGEHIVVRVIKTGKNTVRLGVEAPPEVRIVRGEIVARDHQALAANLLPAMAEIVVDPSPAAQRA